jgi:hypothetical protein
MMRLVQVSASHFCAGIVFDHRHIVVDAAPILRWSMGKSAEYLKAYFERKGWLTRLIAEF